MPTNSKEYSQEYYKNHKKKLLEDKKEYYRKNETTILSKIHKHREASPEKVLLTQVRYRAKKANIPCSLVLEDIVIPDVCPILGIPLFKTKGKISANTPSLDKIKPELGYIRGNIQVISFRANTIKSNSSFEELVTIGRWAKKQLQERT